MHDAKYLFLNKNYRIYDESWGHIPMYIGDVFKDILWAVIKIDCSLKLKYNISINRTVQIYSR